MRISTLTAIHRTLTARMPMVRFATNIPDGKIPSDFELRLTDVLAATMGKPKERIGVEVASQPRLVHGGTREPATMITIKSIGKIGPSENVATTQAVSQLCNEQLGLPADKVVIDFVDLSPHNVGFGGTTVAAAAAKK